MLSNPVNFFVPSAIESVITSLSLWMESTPPQYHPVRSIAGYYTGRGEYQPRGMVMRLLANRCSEPGKQGAPGYGQNMPAREGETAANPALTGRSNGTIVADARRVSKEKD